MVQREQSWDSHNLQERNMHPGVLSMLMLGLEYGMETEKAEGWDGITAVPPLLSI